MPINARLVARNLFNKKSHSVPNIIGLAIGFTCAFAVLAWVKDEFSYDRNLPDSDRIYRLTFETNTSGNRLHFARCWKDWISRLPGTFPQVEEMVWLEPSLHTAIKAGENKFYSDRVFATDSNFLKVFGIGILEGNPENMLNEPFSAIISESLARKCFAAGNPAIGQTIFLSGEYDEKMIPFTIKGIMKDMQTESHIHFDVVTSVVRPLNIGGWAYVYLLLKPNTTPEDILAAFPPFVKQLEEDGKTVYTPHLQKITGIHLFSDKDRELEPNGNITNIFLFLFAAIILMVISWVNYFNLSKARLLLRQKQVQIQLITGSGRRSLIIQSLAESGVYVFLAFIVSILLLNLLSRMTGSFSGISLVEKSFNNMAAIWPLILLILVISIFSGSLPYIQYILTAARPLAVSHKRQWFTTYGVLMTVQFCLSTGLMIASIIIFQQKEIMMSESMGKMSQEVLVFKKQNWEIRSKYKAFRDQAIQNPLVKGFTAAMEEPSGETVDAMNIESLSIDNDLKDKQLYVLSVEDNFLDFFNIPLISGRNFSTYNPDRKGEDYILNETAVKLLGWTPETAIGQPFRIKFPVPDLFYGGTVVGVVKDFNYTTVKQEIKPYVLFQKPIFYLCFMVEVDPLRKGEALSYLKSVWEKELPEYPFQNEFISDLYNTAYQKEFTQARLTGLFSVLAIIVICMGLYSVTSLLVARRIKEIGVRKANGAATGNIILMLSSEFMIWFAVAFAIACPVAWLALNKWLQSFAYRTEIKWWFFVISGIIVLSVTILTVSLQSLRAARMNPVDALRYE